MRAPRVLKQIFFIIFYLAVFFSAAYLIVTLIINRPTCADRIMNQNETGIDCGGKCRPCEKVYSTEDLEVIEKALIPSGIGKYDVVAKIKNPNSNVGSASFDYRFILKDSSGSDIITQSGNGFILPAEEKYIMKIGIVSDKNPAGLEVVIDNFRWEEFTGYEEPNLVINNIKPNLIESGVGYYKVEGLLRNDSDFDFTVINMKIILRDSSSQIIAINESEMKTINAGEERDFRQIWPNHFSGEVSKVEIDPEANVYKNETFLKYYLRTKDSEMHKNTP